MSNDINNKSDNLHDHKTAIQSYMDSLLDSKRSEEDVRNAVIKKTEHCVPKWAEQGFSALKFRSAGLQLYVPVSFVRGIKNIAGQPLETSERSEWIKGAITVKEKTITVIDTEKLLMSDNKRTIDYQHPDANSYVILIGDGGMGLLCDTIGQVKQMTVQDVHWRIDSSRRKWLAGMLQNEVAALIDPRRLALTLSMQGALV